MTREGQLARNHCGAITAPSALRWSLWRDTTVMVNKSGEVIVRWFGRLAGSSGGWSGGLSVTALLTARCLGCAHGLGNDPLGLRAWGDSVVSWYVIRVPALLAWALLEAWVVGGLPLGTRFIRRCTWAWIQGFHKFVGALAVVLTATKKTFPTLRKKATKGYSSGWCG